MMWSRLCDHAAAVPAAPRRLRGLWVSSSWTRFLTCPLLCMSGFFELRTVEVPQLPFLDKVIDVFFVQFIDGVDVPVHVQRRKGSLGHSR